MSRGGIGCGWEIEGDRLVLETPQGPAALPIASLRRLVVRRSARPLQRPTRYLLVRERDGREETLLLGTHRLRGQQAQARVEELARRLSLPVVDVEGARWRAAAFPLLRALGHGQDWRVLQSGLGAGLLVAALPVAIGAGGPPALALALLGATLAALALRGLPPPARAPA